VTFSCLVSLDGEHSENSCASLAEVTVGQDETMSADPTASERPPNKSWCSVYPSLASWLDGVGDNHPIVELSYNREAFDGFAAPLETIISRLELAAPLRLPGRRKAFRTNVQQFLDLRVELNAAFHVCQWPIPSTRWWPRKVPTPQVNLTSFLTRTDLLSLGPPSSEMTRRW
jgi:hypothetical protein